MVLIQLLLPTSGTERVDDRAPLAETRRELAERFNGLSGTCDRRRRDCGPPLMATRNRTTSLWSKS